jgi:hypothetical protein
MSSSVMLLRIFFGLSTNSMSPKGWLLLSSVKLFVNETLQEQLLISVTKPISPTLLQLAQELAFKTTLSPTSSLFAFFILHILFVQLLEKQSKTYLLRQQAKLEIEVPRL